MEAVLSSLDSYWEGFSVTLELLAIGGLGALLLGVVVAFLRISPIASLRWLATGYTELMRNTPLTLVFFFLAIVLPALQLGIDFKVAAYLALALYTSAFVAEAVRSGINGVPVGQAEAQVPQPMHFSGETTMPSSPKEMAPVVHTAAQRRHSPLRWRTSTQRWGSTASSGEFISSMRLIICPWR